MKRFIGDFQKSPPFIQKPPLFRTPCERAPEGEGTLYIKSHRVDDCVVVVVGTNDEEKGQKDSKYSN